MLSSVMAVLTVNSGSAWPATDTKARHARPMAKGSGVMSRPKSSKTIIPGTMSMRRPKAARTVVAAKLSPTVSCRGNSSWPISCLTKARPPPSSSSPVLRLTPGLMVSRKSSPEIVGRTIPALSNEANIRVGGLMRRTSRGASRLDSFENFQSEGSARISAACHSPASWTTNMRTIPNAGLIASSSRRAESPVGWIANTDSGIEMVGKPGGIARLAPLTFSRTDSRSTAGNLPPMVTSPPRSDETSIAVPASESLPPMTPCMSAPSQWRLKCVSCTSTPVGPSGIGQLSASLPEISNSSPVRNLPSCRSETGRDSSQGASTPRSTLTNSPSESNPGLIWKSASASSPTLNVPSIPSVCPAMVRSDCR